MYCVGTVLANGGVHVLRVKDIVGEFKSLASLYFRGGGRVRVRSSQ